jgi:hypothetical protein
MVKMTKEERLKKSIQEARLLSAQGRWAESKLKYEQIIEGLRPQPRKKT